MNDTHDPLDVALTRARPLITERTAALDRELTAMAMASRAFGRRVPKRVAIAAGASAFAVLAGVTAAAATGVTGSAPWDPDPDVFYPFILPSGESCEMRLVFDDPATGGTARELLRDVELDDVIGISPPIGSDEEYAVAIGVAVSQFVSGELAEAGVAPEAQMFTWKSSCTGAFDGEQ